jgi:hypothetical protein
MEFTAREVSGVKKNEFKKKSKININALQDVNE